MKQNIISKVLVALALMATPLLTSSCSNEDNFYTEAVTITGTGIAHHQGTMKIGQTLQLKAAKGILISGTGFEWSSTDTAVATVDQSGLVTAISPGQTTIIARTTGSSISNMGSIEIYVDNQSIGVIDDGIDQSDAE